METMTSQRNLTTEGLPTPNDLNQLKELSNKLNLATRRPSVVQWKQVIEFRKSRGQYLTSGSPQYLDSLVSQRLLHHNAAAVQAPAELAEVLDNRNAQVSSNDFHRQLFGENLNTPTKSNNNNMDGITPTPTRRVRRIGKTTIFESDNDMLVTKAADVANNNAQVSPPIIEEENIQSQDGAQEDLGDLNARYRRVGQMFEELRRDLVIMRIEDNKLARKLLDVRSELTQVRAQKSCEEHADMLDDVAIELEEEEELTGLIKACDLSDRKPASLLSSFSPLRNIGVSRMNLNRRRFSIR